MRTKNKSKIKKTVVEKVELFDPTERYQQVIKQYHVSNPLALKMKLLWIHVTELMHMNMHPSPENKSMLMRAKLNWDLAEMEEVRLSKEE